ncbi:malonyl-ACP O-methyltransferase BioC [Polycladomyces subterraneus]|uniref:Malonyl-[acyl-carrier protein] O-methyltransferase n=1 Tax=Polycladomyces subterraneus TaxID=1016997 RepID=A0ABT8INB6_9BACL|nr:malonyl-ACP O-methyltransferase BioC [Polycladomyces subterraneus]MDN4594266.1 malonyl-ACP O-methyltransferase BioC [Polycladomyces subterraneus]
MLLDKKRVARQFNRHVSTYDNYAVVQKHMAHHMMQTLSERDVRVERILEIGCGTGYLTQLLAERYPSAAITAVDLAENMVKAARDRLGHEATVHFLIGDAETMEWDETFDLIISNATVQWFGAPEHSFRALIDHLQPGGWIVFSTFGPDTFQELHQQFREVERALRLPSGMHGLRLRRPEEWERILRYAGLTDVGSMVRWHRLEYPDCYAFLQSIKQTGASYSASSAAPLSVQRSLLHEVVRRYNQVYRSKYGVYATYHLVQVWGRKGG